MQNYMYNKVNYQSKTSSNNGQEYREKGCFDPGECG